MEIKMDFLAKYQRQIIFFAAFFVFTFIFSLFKIILNINILHFIVPIVIVGVTVVYLAFRKKKDVCAPKINETILKASVVQIKKHLSEESANNLKNHIAYGHSAQMSIYDYLCFIENGLNK